jgi:hypothetical protein
MNLCSVAAGVTDVVFAPNFAEQREVGSCSSLSDLINYKEKRQNQ